MKLKILIITALLLIGCKSTQKTKTIENITSKKTTQIDTVIGFKPIKVEFKEVEIKDTVIVSKDGKSKLRLKNVKVDKGKVTGDIDVIIKPDSVEVKAKVVEESSTVKETKTKETQGLLEIFKSEIIALIIAIAILLFLFRKAIIKFIKIYIPF